jgi:predicted naringenin-chalcone synthase
MGMGCGAAIPNLEAAAGMLARSEEGPVLSLAVEICSAIIFPSHEPELVVSNSIFGDGAAAAVLDLSREGHQGGLAQKELKLAGEALRFSYNVFENYGNMSSPSVLFVLREILDNGRPQPGQKGMLLAFGAGFSAFAALMEFASV